MLSMSKDRVAIIIPAWNEEARLPGVLRDLNKLGYFTIVVDDGSTDNTVRLAEENRAKVLRHIINRFQGAALRTGTKYAILHGYEYIVHFDADGQFRTEDIQVLLQPLLSNDADIVFGSRFLGDNSQMPKSKKNIIMPLGRLVNRWLFNIKLTDPQSGFRAFRANVYSQLAWNQNGMAHCSEILYRAHKANLKIVEVPITVRYFEYGQKLSGGFKILKDLFVAYFIN